MGVGCLLVNFILKVIVRPLAGPVTALRLLNLQRDGLTFCVQFGFLLFLCSCCNYQSCCKQCSIKKICLKRLGNC